MAKTTVKGVRSDKLRRLVRAALRQGWTARVDGRGHMRCDSPDGSGTFQVSMTSRALGHEYENARATARRAGLRTEGL